ncbi:MAG: O-methyltransferase [Bacteroidetes bacterium]|nr:O-methyltransferase [Bacteroidota bacterium]
MKRKMLEFAEQHTTPESGILSKINRETHLTQTHPQMLAGHMQGVLLQMISQMIRPKRILEIGTFTGYSAICLAAGIRHPASGILHTIESNHELGSTIRKYLKEATLEDSVVLHIGDAMEIVPSLDETWDLVFIDADKSNYLNYYQMVLPRVRQGGFILADNVLWGGKVLDDPEKFDSDTLGIVEFNEFVQQDDNVENLVLPFRDGLMIIRKK